MSYKKILVEINNNINLYISWTEIQLSVISLMGPWVFWLLTLALEINKNLENKLKFVQGGRGDLWNQLYAYGRNCLCGNFFILSLYLSLFSSLSLYISLAIFLFLFLSLSIHLTIWGDLWNQLYAYGWNCLCDNFFILSLFICLSFSLSLFTLRAIWRYIKLLYKKNSFVTLI